MKDTDEQKGKSDKIRTDGKSNRLYISNTDLMFFGVNEAERKDRKDTDINELATAFCRVCSKGLKRPLTLRVIAEQLKKSRLGDSQTLVAEIEAAVLRVA